RLFRRGVEDTKRHGLPLLFLRRLAVDASADGHGDGMALVAEPWRNDGAEAAGGTSCGDDQELVRRVHRRIDAVAAVAHHGALADLGPFAAMDAGALMDESGDVGLAPLRRLQMLAQLLGNDQRVVARMDRVVPQVGAHLGSEGLQYLL